MTTAILLGGLVLTLLAALLMRTPEWRLPSLLFALLAIPGNVDNLLPQMRLDPNPIASNTAPVISFGDLLITWALFLTFRQGLFTSWPRPARWAVGVAALIAIAAAAVTAINVGQGADPAAALRGTLVFARIPALLSLSIALRAVLGDGRRLGIAMALGLVTLLGNGLFTSWQLGTTRFTAATFGRNGFSLALMLGALVVAGLAVELWRREQGMARFAALGAFALAGAALFATVATGSRISLLVALPAAIVALLVNRSWWHRRGVVGVGLLVVGVIAVGAAATFWTAEGSRATSVVTDPGNTVDIITDSEGEPSYSSVRTRTRWWGQAFAMIGDDPLTGVGPYQWNIRRYDDDPDAIEIVADPHNTYIQMGAEYGLPVLALYVAGVAAAAMLVLLTVWRRESPAHRSATATAIAMAALMVPITEMTNSHLFNVRLGAVAWLLLGVTLAFTALPALDHGLLPRRDAPQPG